MTYAQKLDCSILTLQNYRNNLPANDPDIPQTDAILYYRNVTLKDYADYITSKRKGGPLSGGLDTPPVPPAP